MYNENLSESIAVLAQLAPGSQTTAQTIGPAKIAGVARVCFLVQVATLSGGATIDFQAYVGLVTGTVTTAVSGATITQITTGVNPIFLVEIKAETIAATLTGALWCKGVVTPATAAAVISGVMLGNSSAYSPASDLTIAGVVQTVVV